jgi:hypothetical protein
MSAKKHREREACESRKMVMSMAAARFAGSLSFYFD